MNLIEKLGGYAAAKRYAESRNGADNTSIYDSLQDTLLEYRRQHNIYEVGDSIIVNDEASSWRIYVIEKNHDNEYFKIRSKDGFRYCRMWRIERHATDAEIQAGNRL